MSEEPIEITVEELEAEPDPPPAVYPRVAGWSGQVPPIEISADDLEPQTTAKPLAKGIAAKTRVSLDPLLRKGILAGALGGFFAWVVTEVFYGDRNYYDNASMILGIGIWGGILGSVISGTLNVMEGYYQENKLRFTPTLLKSLGVGFFCAFIGSGIAQAFYSALGGGTQKTFLLQIVLRSTAWAFAGLGIGAGQAVIRPSAQRTRNALLGGLAGGFIGGLLFDPICAVIGTDVYSRAVGITVMGLCTGGAINLVEQLTKEAWLSVIRGAFTGKEFILYGNSVIIGSGGKSTIVLFRDPGVLGQHAEFRAEGGGWWLNDAHPTPATFVNGEAVRRRRLREGDIVRIGEAALVYHERKVVA